MSLEKTAKGSGVRHKARESALQMLFAADLVKTEPAILCASYWAELGEADCDDKTRDFANKLVAGAREKVSVLDDRIRTRAEHWRIERMAIVDRNVLRLAVYEFLFEDTPHTGVINEALEIARRFSTFEATQFINGILDAIKLKNKKAATSDPSETEKADSKSNASA